MDPTLLLGVLSAAIGRHQELKMEVKVVEQRCDHLRRVHLLWSSYFDRASRNDLLHGEEATRNQFFLVNEQSYDKNTSRLSPSNSDNRLHRFSKRIKRILSNRTGDHTYSDKGSALKAINGTLARSRSEEEPSRTLPSFSPSVFLVSEISKQMCGHHGLKLDGIDRNKEEKSRGKQGRKSVSLSADNHATRCSRRASCDVVSPFSSSSIDCQMPNASVNKTGQARTKSHLRPRMSSTDSSTGKNFTSQSSFPEILASVQPNIFLPFLHARPPSSMALRLPPSLSTLHEELIPQTIVCDSFEESFRGLKSAQEFFGNLETTETSVSSAESDSRSVPGGASDVNIEDDLDLLKIPRDPNEGNHATPEEINNDDLFPGKNYFHVPSREEYLEAKSAKTKPYRDSDACTRPIQSREFDQGSAETTPRPRIPTPKSGSTPIATEEDKKSRRPSLNANSSQNSEMKNLKRRLKITEFKVSFLDELLDSRICWVEKMTSSNACSALKELKLLRSTFKSHVDGLLQELNEQEGSETENRQVRSYLKDLEESILAGHRDGMISPKLLIFCISRLLQMFHAKFVEMKRCLSRKDLILQSLEGNLIVEQVANRLLKYERRKKSKEQKIRINLDEKDADSCAFAIEVKEYQQEKEYVCLKGVETFESEMEKIIRKAEGNRMNDVLQKQSGPTKAPIDRPPSSKKVVTIRSASTESLNLIRKSQTDIKSHECLDSSVNRCSLDELSENLVPMKKNENSSPDNKSNAIEREIVYEFSLNDLLVGQEKHYFDSNVPCQASQNRDHKTFTSCGKRNHLSIFRPTIKKSDWIIREAKLPYFEIKSFNKSSEEMGERRQETKGKELEHSSCPIEKKDFLESPSLNVSHVLNKSDPVKELYKEVVPNRGRSERNSLDVWTCVEGYHESEETDRYARKSSESSRRSSKMLLHKISPNKSPLNICKSLCLVNGQSGSIDGDGTRE